MYCYWFFQYFLVTLSLRSVAAFCPLGACLPRERLPLAVSSGNPFTREVAAPPAVTQERSELPDSFDAAVSIAASKANECFQGGLTRVRIDFDTSVGDVTFTSLKNTLPVLKQLTACLADQLGLQDEDKEEGTTTEGCSLTEEQAIEAAAAAELRTGDTGTSLEGLDLSLGTEEESTTPGLLDKATARAVRARTQEEVAAVQKGWRVGGSDRGAIRLVFPDMGAAALMRRDWKMGTPQSQVPACVVTASIQNDQLQPMDRLCVLVCPLYSEQDLVKTFMQRCDEQGVPLLLLNPELINMDQGYGVRARNLRKEVLSTFTMAYKLKTLANGALVRQWPRGFTLWNEDASAEDGSGYSHIESYVNEPTREIIVDTFDALYPAGSETDAAATDGRNKEEPNAVAAIAGGISGFFKGMSRL